MRRSMAALAMGLAVLLALPASAGASGTKCPLPIDVCLKQMAEKMRTTGWIGLEMEEKIEAAGGYRVKNVIPGSPAEKAGIQHGDLLWAIDAIRLAPDDPGAFERAKTGWRPGQNVKFTIQRGGVERHIVITLAPMPADIMARWIGMHMLEHVPPEPASASNR